jgi:hypothetical protein
MRGFAPDNQLLARLGNQPRGAIAWPSPERVRIVRITVVPHCTQVWVMSSRSSDREPFSNSAGVTAVIASRCPQCEQGRRTLGRRDDAIFAYCMRHADSAMIPRYLSTCAYFPPVS